MLLTGSWAVFQKFQDRFQKKGGASAARGRTAANLSRLRVLVGFWPTSGEIPRVLRVRRERGKNAAAASPAVAAGFLGSGKAISTRCRKPAAAAPPRVVSALPPASLLGPHSRHLWNGTVVLLACKDPALLNLALFFRKSCPASLQNPTPDSRFSWSKGRAMYCI